MDIIPAVDIMKGNVVRLTKGNPDLAKSYKHLGDPVSLAKKWETEGAPIIHIVDLDAAIGLGSNLETIHSIIKTVNIPVQVGGGIRNLTAAKKLLREGAQRIILGSLAFKSSFKIRELLGEFGNERIIIALDNIQQDVMIYGWKTLSGMTVSEAVTKFTSLGVKLFLVTSVSRDGTLSGPDIETLAKICSFKVEVIAAGGIRNLDDIKALNILGLSGVVVGKALYEGIFSLNEALKTIGEK